MATKPTSKRCLAPNGTPLGCPGDHIYKATGECVICTAAKLWAHAKGHPDEFPLSNAGAARLGLDYTINGRPCLDGPHLLAKPLAGGKCVACKGTSPRQIAIKAGKKKYFPSKPCKKCKKTAKKRTDNGKCDGCRQEVQSAKAKSPRQLAKSANEQKYLPVDPCVRCGQVSMRRVDTGRCDGCHAPSINDITRQVIAEMGSAATINRDVALTMGLTAYRDGKCCPEGHREWKYVKGDDCVTCDQNT